MLYQPEVDISIANGNIYKIIDLCVMELKKTGKKLHQEDDYQKAINDMLSKINESKAYIRTLAILATYCKILDK